MANGMLIQISEEDKQRIREAEELLRLLRKEVSRAKAAGFDVEEAEKQIPILEKQIQAIKRHYL